MTYEHLLTEREKDILALKEKITRLEMGLSHLNDELGRLSVENTANEIEMLKLEKAANEETIKQLTRQRGPWEKLNELRKDGTLEALTNDADRLDGRGFISTIQALNIRRVVQAIRKVTDDE
jgi:predicted nuclease with TOPRIM domain